MFEEIQVSGHLETENIEKIRSSKKVNFATFLGKVSSLRSIIKRKGYSHSTGP